MNQELSDKRTSYFNQRSSKRILLIAYIVVLHLVVIGFIFQMINRSGWIDANAAEKIGYGIALHDCINTQNTPGVSDCGLLKFSKMERLYVDLPIANDQRATWLVTFKTPNNTYIVNLSATGNRTS